MTTCEKCKTLDWCGDHGSDGVVHARNEEIARLKEQRDKCWRAIRRMASALGPSWVPAWIKELFEDGGSLPEEFPGD